jgi:hypothetical protein
MKIETFDIFENGEEIADLLNNEEYTIKKIATFNTDNQWLLVIYEINEEQQIHETKRLEQVKDVARSIRDDKVYSKLKNVNQRCLYLLDKYGIQKSIALDVIDEELVQKLTLVSASASALPEQNPET